MTSRNPITGDKLQSKPATKEYRDGWDAIFGKAEQKLRGKNTECFCTGACREVEKQKEKDIASSD